MWVNSRRGFPVGTRLPRESDTSVLQTDRVIVLRGQARLQRRQRFNVGAVLARDKGTAILQANQLNLIAGKHRSHRIFSDQLASGNLPPERRQRIENRLAIALSHHPAVQQCDGAAVFFGAQQAAAGLDQAQ